MGHWNDTETPLAHLITFRAYGTWLHGDERGSIDRFNNRYKSPYISPNGKWQKHNTATLKGNPVTLSAVQRTSIQNAVRETCNIRGWLLLAFNIKTNHVHSVVSIGAKKAEIALNALKANATRHMRADGNWIETNSPWSDKGSKRNLWNERSVERAIDYVINGQGNDLPDFDDE